MSQLKNTLLSLVILLAGTLAGCGEEIDRRPGAYCELELDLNTPPYQDVFLGLSSLRLNMSAPDGQEFTHAIDHTTTEFVLNLSPGEGLVLRLEGLDVDGRVVATGVSRPFDLVPDQLSQVPILFSRVGEFARLGGSLGQARFGHSATAMGDGRVLIFGGAAGGDLDNPSDLALPEIYDLDQQASCTAGGFPCPTYGSGLHRMGHSATLASQDKILIFGGRDEARSLVEDILIFDLGAQSFRTLGGYDSSKVVLRTKHAAAAVRVAENGSGDYRDSVVILGGQVDLAQQTQATDNGLLFDGALENFSRTDLVMGSPRYGFSATSFSDEQRLVLLAGGRDDNGLVLPVELFNGVQLEPVMPIGGAARAGLAKGRINHAAVKTEQGIMLLGGDDGLLSMDAPELFVFQAALGTGVLSLAIGASHAEHSTRSGALTLPLATGEIVQAGGEFLDGFERIGLSSAEIMVPDGSGTSVSFGASPSLGVSLSFPSVTRLFNGAYLICGGLVFENGQANPGDGIWYYNPG